VGQQLSRLWKWGIGLSIGSSSSQLLCGVDWVGLRDIIATINKYKRFNFDLQLPIIFFFNIQLCQYIFKKYSPFSLSFVLRWFFVYILSNWLHLNYLFNPMELQYLRTHTHQRHQEWHLKCILTSVLWVSPSIWFGFVFRIYRFNI